METSTQIIAARALLSWSQADLAHAASIGIATLQRIEQQQAIQARPETIAAIKGAFEAHGIEFLSGRSSVGVRLKRKSK